MKWLIDSKRNLLEMREQIWLSESEMVIVDRGIAALDRLLTVSDTNRKDTL
jgi:hypothetical protein